MNHDLRKALLAKTLLNYGKISQYNLIKTSVDEAYLHVTNPDELHKKSVKIYKNLLKTFSKKDLIKYIDFYNVYNFSTVSKTSVIDYITTKNLSYLTSKVLGKWKF